MLTLVSRVVFYTALAMVAWSAIWFWRKKTPIEPHHTPKTLIFEGPYRVSRNPIYLALVLLTFASALGHGSIFGIICTVILWIILDRRFAAKEEALSKMIIRAPSAGIILSIHGKVGEKVNTDRLLIEMSDLTNFKIRGKVDDDYAENLKTGTKVYVGLDNEKLVGVVGTVNPVIRDRKIEFDVNLQESSHNKLRPNRSVSLDIVRAERDSVIRIPTGPVIGKGNEHEVYVLGNGQPVKRVIVTGIRNSEFIEVKEGLEEGDRVVLSNISNEHELEELEVNE